MDSVLLGVENSKLQFAKTISNMGELPLKERLGTCYRAIGNAAAPVPQCALHKSPRLRTNRHTFSDSSEKFNNGDKG